MIRKTVLPLITAALREDGASHDLTSRAVIPSGARIRARIIAKSRGVLAGVRMAALTFTTLDPSLRCRLHLHSGATLAPGETILTIEGRARSIFAAERTALNFLQHLSGIATLTAEYVRRVKGTRARIYDTRKTIPGLRLLEKSAVGAGGGKSHRADLSEAVLIKTNHLKVLGKGERGRGNVIQKATEQAKRVQPKRFVEVEVTTMAQLGAALKARPNAVLLDNWRLTDIRKAVRLARKFVPRSPFSVPLIEVSGGVTLDNVRAIAKTGVDRISIGRLTHSAPALDMSLEVGSTVNGQRSTA
jgi:nicotinate-nucleotide pyrophosphorylase (carboxylating)